jgi:hypothetical protein
MIRETQAPFLRVRAQILQRSIERRVTVFRRSAFARLIVRGYGETPFARLWLASHVGALRAPT